MPLPPSQQAVYFCSLVPARVTLLLPRLYLILGLAVTPRPSVSYRAPSPLAPSLPTGRVLFTFHSLQHFLPHAVQHPAMLRPAPS